MTGKPAGLLRVGDCLSACPFTPSQPAWGEGRRPVPGGHPWSDGRAARAYGAPVFKETDSAMLITAFLGVE